MPRNRRWMCLAMLAGGVATSGCSEIFSDGCLDNLAYTLTVEVRDQASGAPAAFGVTGVSVHDSGQRIEFGAIDDLTLGGDGPEELRGRHTIFLRKPGFVLAPVRTILFEDACHVRPRTVQARIGPDAEASPVEPISFTEGAVIETYQPWGEVEIQGDTLVINGRAYSGCSGFRAVAYRRGLGLHVQIEPSDRTGPCSALRLFEARYLLPPGPTNLLVTNPIGFPAVWFEGEVQPH